MNGHIGMDMLIMLKTNVFLCYDFSRRFQTENNIRRLL